MITCILEIKINWKLTDTLLACYLMVQWIMEKQVYKQNLNNLMLMAHRLPRLRWYYPPVIDIKIMFVC